MENAGEKTGGAVASWHVYMLRCEDGSLYTGITTDPARRMREHLGLAPGGARYTRAHRPDALVALWMTGSRSGAARLESAIKRLDRKGKDDLVAHPERAGGVARGVSCAPVPPRERDAFWPL